MSRLNNSDTADHELYIDRSAAQRQLEYLGYKSGENVYLRFFYHSDDARKHNDKGRKLNRLHWKEVEDYQRDGRGVYVVVNGAGGGHEDKDIKQCVAIFCEWDDCPVEEQLLHWETVGFLEPTFTIYSGDKSAQPYWVFDKPIAPVQWRELQRLLIEVMGADPSNKNPSRVFRLAGGWHIKPGRERVRTEIVQDSGKKYSIDQVRDLLLNLHSSQQQELGVEPEATTAGQPQMRSRLVDRASQYQRYEDISIPVTVSVPLSACLSKQSRSLLDSGESLGGRNVGGAKLVRDLIGTANYLQTIGQDFDGDTRQLLDDYASRCTPPLPAGEVEAIWKSASKSSPEPSCKPEGVEACIRGWYWNNYVNSSQRSHSNSQQQGRGFGAGLGMTRSDTQPIAAVSLTDRIREILSRYESESLQVNALMDLASVTGRTYNDISKLARIIRSEGDLADEVIEAVKSFQGTLKSCRKRLDIARYLEPVLAKPMLAKAGAMPTAPEYLFNTTLATTGSRIGTAARIVINPEGGYKQPCILWTANVSHSGQAKTPPQQEIINPLEEMEAAASELYDAQLDDYERSSDKDARPPVRQRRLLNNVTSSTKIRIHGQNPRGLLEYIDELVADYSRLNQYKSGKGDDLQLELGFWNGASVNYDRQDLQLFLKRTAFSKTGTYQWDTLARLMADETNFIASGYSARFLYCSILDAPPRYLDLLSTTGDNTLAQVLYWLYSELEKLNEADYLLSHEAKVLFQGWNHTLVNAEIEESHFGLSLVYAKIEANTARIALWLHIVNATLRGEKPTAVISGETMRCAIEIASFYLWQHKLIHAHNSPTRKLEGIFLKVQTQAEKFFAKSGKGVSASFLKTRINSLKSWVVEKIRSTVFKTLASAGHGRIEGEGAEMTYIPSTIPDSPPDSSNSSCASNQNSQATDSIGHSSSLTCFDESEASDAVGDIGGELVASPTAENTASHDLQAQVGSVGVSATPDLSSKQSEQAGQELDSSDRHPVSHQFTNSIPETVAISEVDAVGDATNTPPTPPTASTASTVQELAVTILQCTTWVELVQIVDGDGQKLVAATGEMVHQQRQKVSSLLATHLCSSPEDLGQLTWLYPKLTKLIHRALEKLTFTIRKIGGDTIESACWSEISGCKFESLERLGAYGERWIFIAPNQEKLSLSGTSEITAIGFLG